MPLYPFVDKRGVETDVYCSMSEIEARTAEMTRMGFRRVFTKPNMTVVPGYYEALEDETRMADDPFRGRKDVPTRLLTGLENP